MFAGPARGPWPKVKGCILRKPQQNHWSKTRIVHDTLQKDRKTIQSKLRGRLRVSFLKWFPYVPRPVWNPGRVTHSCEDWVCFTSWPKGCWKGEGWHCFVWTKSESHPVSLVQKAPVWRFRWCSSSHTIQPGGQVLLLAGSGAWASILHWWLMSR